MLVDKMVNKDILLFFSSRRRHTRFDCDWSSDVCSSDLLLGRLMSCGVKCLDDPRFHEDTFFSRVRRKEIRGGDIVVLQTHGRSGQYNPHLHIIATSGGMDQESQR